MNHAAQIYRARSGHVRKISRKRAAEARAARRSVVLVVAGALGGGAVFGGLLALSPMCLTPQSVVAQVLRGETINLSVTTETNLTALTNPSFSATNSPAVGTNQVGMIPAAAVTNERPTFVTVGGGKYRSATYQQLASFRFNLTEDVSSPDANPFVATVRVLEQIPAEIRALNERPVALTGFMLPVKWNEGLVTDFMLLPNTMGCCYGRMPRINEIVIVNTGGKGVKLLKDIPVCVLGTFHVGAIRNDNYLIGIYQMDCECVVEASSLTSK